LPSEYDPQTISFYDEHGTEFCASTVNVDMSPLYRAFLDHIPAGGRILDAGCGSGRDSLAFLKLGYQVVSIDASTEMASATTRLTGHNALLMRFDEMTFDSEFDGVWACASLLHTSRQGLAPVLTRVARTMKPGGTLYCSFKYGKSERIENGRLFNDQDEASFQAVVSDQLDLELLRLWATDDVRPGRNEQWLNALARRSGDPGRL
jgi:SAM-dependent methyltransferase